MRIASLALCLGLAFCPNAEAAWAHVQGPHLANTGFTSSSTIVLGGSVIGSGNLVIGVLTFDTTATQTVNSISDDKSNSYTVLKNLHDSSAGEQVVCFWLNNITNGPATITATLAAGSTFRGMMWDEFSGGSTGTTTDGSASQISQLNPGNAADGVTSTNLTSTANGDLIWGATYATDGTFPTATAAGTGFTLGASDSGDANVPGITEWLAQGTAGSKAATMTDTGANSTTGQTTCAQALSLTALGGGTVVPKMPLLGVGP